MFDWHQFHHDETHKSAVVDPRRRVRICLAVLAAPLAVIFFRALQLELAYGAAYRAEVRRPIEKERIVPGMLQAKFWARDGTVLACDKEFSAVAVRYRYLQNPPDAQWLKTTARARLSKSDRAKPERVAEEQDRVQAKRDQMAHRLAKLCNMTDAAWSARAAKIQSRVERIAARANARQEQKAEDADDEAEESYAAWLVRSLKEPQSPPKITVAEELEYHVICDNPPAAAVAEIERHPEEFPGVKVVKQWRRYYPQGKSAANVLGYLGLSDGAQIREGEAPAEALTEEAIAATSSAGREPRPPAASHDYHANDWVGKTGIEKSY